ncbi:hypothetical protein CAMGR0001_0698 [Campylobacter gracilis RM3268]|uniref:Uncharacterized protein n=1 Tax=Campylobacter gracilis RM3268 TaxID=553220 RepID=C8PFQ6_9BACT|nr:hypothetical protein CAMGR0001_0698 [Campylobacter gracilis RM3268]
MLPRALFICIRANVMKSTQTKMIAITKKTEILVIKECFIR